MRARFLTLFAAVAVVAAGVGAGTQSSIPRMPDGRPDLTGTYDLATLTPVERPAGTPLVLTADEAAKREKQAAMRFVLGAQPSKGDREAPPVGGDGSPGPAGNVGGYNTFWLDPGSHFSLVNGEIRASLVVDPPDGRVPPLTEDARKRIAARRVAVTSDQVSREGDPGWEGPGAYDDPERRPLGERCLLGFGSTSGPPVLPNYFYNNLHQIVQTPDHVMILTEMVHDARIIRMNAEHLPKTIRKWMGDSVGWWEGDTLVVETTNFTDRTRFRGATENLRVVERFTRVDDKTLLYRFTIEDPATWERPWTGEYTWPATGDLIYEYACHEGNYALENILRGARAKEARDAAAAKKTSALKKPESEKKK
ncbi:MAG: hypothetical protein HY654_01965 [Acidobacteria bacterium]|nr:hypothetical protein [Acidobacteriota bacterium]